MISYRLNFVGVQLLLLAYTAQSFVLLTANIDDIKNLARKFVSDSVADKLADFVVKATEQMSDHKVDIDTSGKTSIKALDTSENNEYSIRNIARQREKQEKQPRTTKTEKQEYASKTRNEERQKPNYLSNESKELSAERENRLLGNEKKWQSKEKSLEQTEKQEKFTMKNWRDKFEKSKESEHRMSSVPKNVWSLDNNAMTNNNLSSHERPKHLSQYGKEEGKKEYDHPSKQFQSYYKESHKDYEPMQYTKTTASKTYFLTNKPPKYKKSEPKTSEERLPEFENTHSIGSRYKKIKDHDSKMLTFDFKSPKSKMSIKHDEQESSAEHSSLKYTKISKDHDFKMPTVHSNEFNNVKSDEKSWDLKTTRFRGISFNNGDSITTEKERTDFDQYNNRNYPKAEFIATSGKMMLPKISPNVDENSKPDLESWWEKELKLPNTAQLKSWLSTM